MSNGDEEENENGDQKETVELVIMELGKH